MIHTYDEEPKPVPSTFTNVAVNRVENMLDAVEISIIWNTFEI
jgi:hypothetical protein